MSLTGEFGREHRDRLGQHINRPIELRQIQPLVRRVIQRTVPGAVRRDRAVPDRAHDIEIRGAGLELRPSVLLRLVSYTY